MGLQGDDISELSNTYQMNFYFGYKSSMPSKSPHPGIKKAYTRGSAKTWCRQKLGGFDGLKIWQHWRQMRNMAGSMISSRTC